MKEADVSRAALYLALTAIALTLFMVAALAIEAFLKMDDAADWAAAIGGFLAVAAAAIIAIVQSRQNTALIRAQGRLQAESLEAQKAMQAAGFSHEIAMAAEASDRERSAAIGAIKTAYTLMCRPISALSRIDDNPSGDFLEAWGPDAELALSLSKSIQYLHLKNADDIQNVGLISVSFTDCWLALTNGTTAKDRETKFFYRKVAKSKIARARRFIQQLDPTWEGEWKSDYELNEEETAAYAKIAQTPASSLDSTAT